MTLPVIEKRLRRDEGVRHGGPRDWSADVSAHSSRTLNGQPSTHLDAQSNPPLLSSWPRMPLHCAGWGRPPRLLRSRGSKASTDRSSRITLSRFDVSIVIGASRERVMQVTRSHLAVTLASFGVLLIGTAVSVDAQSRTGAPGANGTTAASTAPPKWVAPRTAWGDPDFEGLWPAIDMQGTPYERPQDVQGEVLSDAQFAERQRTRQQQAEQDAEQFLVNRPRPNAGTGPPSHWGSAATLHGRRHSSSIRRRAAFLR